MNPLAKLAAFVALLALVFGVGIGIGRAAGPFDAPATHTEHIMDGG